MNVNVTNGRCRNCYGAVTTCWCQWRWVAYYLIPVPVSPDQEGKNRMAETESTVQSWTLYVCEWCGTASLTPLGGHWPTPERVCKGGLCPAVVVARREDVEDRAVALLREYADGLSGLGAVERRGQRQAADWLETKYRVERKFGADRG